MITLYKLVNQNYETTNLTKWRLDVTNFATGEGEQLCTDGVLHAYISPLLAVLLNPQHARIQNPILLVVTTTAVVAGDGTKVGAKDMTPVKVLPLPEITTTQKVAFGIYCALGVYREPGFTEWAEGWLSGRDRSIVAAEKMVRTSSAAARAAVRAAAVLERARAMASARAAVRAAMHWRAMASAGASARAAAHARAEIELRMEAKVTVKVVDVKAANTVAQFSSEEAAEKAAEAATEAVDAVMWFERKKDTLARAAAMAEEMLLNCAKRALLIK